MSTSTAVAEQQQHTNPVCPNCNTELDAMGVSDIVDFVHGTGAWPKFHANYHSKLVATGSFPAPWWVASGRKMWLRSQVEEWWANRAAGDRRKAEEAALSLLGGLSGDELDAALADLKQKVEAAHRA